MNTQSLTGLRRRSLACAITSALVLAASQAAAQTGDQASEDRLDIEEVVVTATPIDRASTELTQSAVVLQGSDLNSEVTNSLGDTLSRLPGLSNASFGQNVGRPVIRGQQKARIGVLQDGMNIFDASAPSQDHAVATEPFLADSIEVLLGPNTLLYGSSAIGGVVNVVTNTIPLAVPEDGFEGRVMIQGDSAADERFGAGRLDFGTGSFAFHVSGFYRRTDDYEIPGAAELFPDEDHDDDHEGEDHDDDHDHEEEEMTGVLENSFLDNEGGSIGGAWIGDNWRAGISYTAYNSNYGIPGGHEHAHGDEDEDHDHDEDHDEDHDHEGEEEEEEIVTIDLESERIDAVLNGTDPFAGFSEFDLKVGITDYTHTEFEGVETGTVFDSEATDLRLQLSHNPIGVLQGAFGLQWSDSDFSAVGEEAFVPPSTTETWGLFLVETWEINDSFLIDFGLRYEDTQIDSFLIEHEHEEEEHGEEEHDDEPPVPASRDFNPFSVSLGAKWEVNDFSHLTFEIARAERAPSSYELFSNGPHIATQTFEIGDPNLNKETNNHYAATYRIHSGSLTGAVTLYLDDYDDYIYQANTGEMEDGFPVAVWQQQDADFTGGEIELRYDFGLTDLGRWQLFGFYDYVDAELADGSNVPRIPPQRIGVGVDWDTERWGANVTWINADDHTDTAEFETPTPGYDLLNAEIAYFLPLAGGDAELEFYLQGRNLLDEDIRNSTSFLKDDAPQIGRNFVFGVRAYF
ncbi:MAG: TonB-dependent receptor [Pseudomonadota bacterium]